MNPKDWSLTRRIFALCATVAALLALLAAAAAVTAGHSGSEVDTLVNRTGPLRTDGERLLTAVLNQETGIRGYALGGREDNLASYTEGVRDEEALTADMRRLFRGDVALTARLTDVTSQTTAWRRVVAEPVIARVRAGDVPGAQRLVDEASRQRFDQIRAAIADLQNAIAVMRAQVAADLHRTTNDVVWVLVVAGIVVIVAGALLAVLLQRMLADPVTELARQVRLVADGDFDRKITASGPREVTGLGHDIERMRQQIAADLRTVRAARARIEEANQRLEQQAEELTRSNRDLEQFAYVASHDLQEPLRKVASFCQLLQRRYAGQLDERADQYITFAVDGAQRMQRLINDLLSFSRIGRLTAGFTNVDLGAVVLDAVDQLSTAVEQTGARVEWHDLPTVRGEEPLLSRLLTNLIGNSLKFHRPGVPPVVTITAERDGDMWEIGCGDNGIGVEPEFADKIFVIFQRLHAKDAYPGTGIGLAIAKKIVEYHGGRIWLDTSQSEGTLIRFTLPVAVDVDVDGAAPEPGTEDASAEPVEETV
ncbi:MAG TPA: CHASE3 domain-containing protein [Micromonosporaceae bacterium]